jgi:Acetyltransferase (GNAT) domain
LNIQIINPITYQGWDELLLTSDQSTFFHTSAWAKVLHESYNYKPLYFTLIENDRLKTLLPVMEINSFITGKRGVSLPFTDHCPPIAKNEKVFTETFNAVIQYGKKANWKAINLKCCVNYLRGSTLPFETFLTHDLDVSQTAEEIFSTFRDSTKRNIKKAIQNGVHVNIQNTLESIREYYRLHCITRKNHGLPPHPFYFFKKIYEHIVSKKKGFVALAAHKNKVIAGAVFFQFGNRAIFKYGASDPRYLSLRPNNLVMWEAIKRHCQNGFSAFNFGRTELKHKGLLQFKRGWGTKEEILNYYRYDLKQNCYVTKKYGIKSSYNFFKIMPAPILRLAGNILYRHVG